MLLRGMRRKRRTSRWERRRMKERTEMWRRKTQRKRKKRRKEELSMAELV